MNRIAARAGQGNSLPTILLLFVLVATFGIGCGTQGGPKPYSASDPETSYPSDTAHPQVFVQSQGHHARIASLAYDSTSETLYSAGLDKSIYVWDVASHQSIAKIHLPSWKGLDGAVYAIDVSPNDRWLAAGGCQGCSGGWAEESPFAVHIVATETREIISTGFLRSSLHSLAYSPGGDFLATGEYNGTLTLWRVEENGALFEDAVLTGHGGMISEIAWFADSNRLVTIANDGLLVLWARHPLGGWFPEWNLDARSHFGSIAVAPDDSQILAGLLDGRIVLVDPTSGEITGRLEKPNDGFVFALQYSKDGKSVVYGSTKRSSGVSENATGIGRISLADQVHTFEATEENVFEVEWSGDPQELIAVAGSSSHQIRLHRGTDLSTAQPLADAGIPVDWLRTRDSLIGWKTQKKAPLTDAFDLEQVSMVPVSSDAGFDTGPPLDGQLLFVNNPRDGSLATKGGFSGNVRIMSVTDDRITSWAMYAPNQVLTGSGHLLHVVDFTTRKRTRCYGHTGDVGSLSWLRADQLFVSTASDRTIRIWNASNCELLLSIFVAQSGEWAAWTPDAYFAYSENGASLIGLQVNHGLSKSPAIYSVGDFPEREARERIVRVLSAGTARGELIIDAPRTSKNEPIQ